MGTKSIKKIDKLATFLLVMIMVGNLQPYPPLEMSFEPYGGALVSTLNNGASYVLLSILLVRHWKEIIYTGARSIPLLFLLGLMFISVLWSPDPQSTLELSKGMLRISLTAAYLSWQYSIKEQMWMLSWVLGIGALLSLLVCLFFPFYGVHQSSDFPGAWCGIYGHKNTLGANMALSAGVFLHLALSNNRYWWILWPGFTVSVILTFFSKSTTAVGIVLAFIIMLFVYKLIQKNQYKLQVIFICLAILLILIGSIWFMNNAESLAATQGKDLSLTGRTPLWSDLLGKIAQKPLLGYGLGGFWKSAEALDVRAKYTWAGQAHNGFIDIGLQLGLVGFILWTISFSQCFLKALSRIVFHAKTWEDCWPIQVIVFLFLLNSSEASLLLPFNVYWFLYVTILLSLSLESQRIRKAGYKKKIKNSLPEGSRNI